MDICQKLQTMEGTSSVGINIGKTFGTGGTKTYVTVNAVMRKKPQSFEQATNDVARFVLTNYPDAKNKDFLNIVVVYGFDIGIASGWQNYHAGYSPAEWETKLAGGK